ncbi:hypothetical protein ABBQ32_006340 [Trebouxia sp. C0010 RCD-2024]
MVAAVVGAGVVGAGVGVDQLGVAAETHTPTVDALDLHREKKQRRSEKTAGEEEGEEAGLDSDVKRFWAVAGEPAAAWQSHARMLQGTALEPHEPLPAYLPAPGSHGHRAHA